jgi:hypothetical protein
LAPNIEASVDQLDYRERYQQVHDTIRHFLRAQTGTEGLVTQQRRLLQALDEVRAPDQDASSRQYYYLHLPYHLAEANERQTLDSLLLDPRPHRRPLRSGHRALHAARRPPRLGL